jgi:hypothetical protein
MTVSAARGESVDSLRREADTTRANLTDTVVALRLQVSDTADHLRDTVSPSAIKQQVKDYVRDSSEGMLHTLQRQARENPLQAVAIGAGLAFPLWKLARAIPAPLLLIGAGLALSRSNALREASADAIDQVRETTADVQDAARRAMHDSHEDIGDSADRAAEAGPSLRQRVIGAADDLKTSITQGAQDGVSHAKDALNATGENVRAAVDRASDKIGHTYAQNPLLIAGIGMAVGALIAASLPATSTENRLFGDASEKLRRRAIDQAAEGLETAKAAAADVMDAAEREGLSAEGLSDAAQDLTQKARAVVDRGVDAALGESKNQ